MDNFKVDILTECNEISKNNIKLMEIFRSYAIKLNIYY